MHGAKSPVWFGALNPHVAVSIRVQTTCLLETKRRNGWPRETAGNVDLIQSAAHFRDKC